MKLYKHSDKMEFYKNVGCDCTIKEYCHCPKLKYIGYL